MSNSPAPGLGSKGTQLANIRTMAKSAESLLKLLSLIAVLLYAIGIVVTNMYLSRYSITDFAILKPQCLMTGIWAVIVIALACIPGGGALLIANADESLWRKLPRIVIGIPFLSVIVSFVAWFLFNTLGDFADSRAWNPPFWTVNPFQWNSPGWRQLLWGTNFLAAVVLFFHLNLLWRTNRRGVKFKSMLLWLIPLLALVVVGVGETVYPEISPRFGGGRPVPVNLKFNNDGDGVFAFIKTMHPAIINEDHKYVEADLTYIGTDSYVVAIYSCYPSGAKAAEHTLIIDKKLVSLIQPLPSDLSDPCKF